MKRSRSRSRGVQASRRNAGHARLRNPKAEDAALLWFEALLHCVAGSQRDAQNHPKGCRGCACGPSAPLGGQSGRRPFKEGISIMFGGYVCNCIRDILWEGESPRTPHFVWEGETLGPHVHAASAVACALFTPWLRLSAGTETTKLQSVLSKYTIDTRF